MFRKFKNITGYIKVLLVVAMSTVHSHLNHMPIYGICLYIWLSTVDDAMTVVASMLHVMTERHLTQIITVFRLNPLYKAWALLTFITYYALILFTSS